MTTSLGPAWGVVRRMCACARHTKNRTSFQRSRRSGKKMASSAHLRRAAILFPVRLVRTHVAEAQSLDWNTSEDGAPTINDQSKRRCSRLNWAGSRLGMRCQYKQIQFFLCVRIERACAVGYMHAHTRPYPAAKIAKIEDMGCQLSFEIHTVDEMRQAFEKCRPIKISCFFRLECTGSRTPHGVHD